MFIGKRQGLDHIFNTPHKNGPELLLKMNVRPMQWYFQRHKTVVFSDVHQDVK